MSNNPIEILSCFSNLDIKGLKLRLKDDHTYQETTKEVFLKKIDTIFNSLKKDGDTELIIKNGVCCSKECDNSGKKGCLFVGNNSKKHFSLIFEVENDEVKDIFQCYDFNSQAKKEELGREEFITVDFDERADFFKTSEYYTKVEGARNALRELLQDPPLVLDFSDICNWLEKYQLLNQTIGDYIIFMPKMKWTPFSELYSDLSDCKVFLWKNLDKVISMNNSLDNIKNEEELVEWVLEGESIYEDAPFDFKYRYTRNNQIFTFGGNDKILFTGIEFVQVLDFIENHQKQQEVLFKKYNTLTIQERNDAYGKDYKSNVGKLSYHIAKRKEAIELGIEIPFYITN